MPLTLAAALIAAAASGAPSVFVLHPEAEALVLEPRPGLDETASGTDGGEDEPPSAALSVKKGTAYRMVDLKGVGETVTTSADGKEGEHGCGGAKRGLIAFSKLPASETPYVLVPGDWAAAPATVIEDDVTKPDYQAVIDATLATINIKGGKALSGQALKADLDGDGIAEIIVSATNVAADAERAKVGDYAVVGVQRAKDGKPVTISVLAQVVDEGNIDMIEMPIVTSPVIAIADLDGDKTMEVVTLTVGMEEHSVDAWHIEEDASVRIPFQAYCGV